MPWNINVNNSADFLTNSLNFFVVLEQDLSMSNIEFCQDRILTSRVMAQACPDLISNTYLEMK